jgi:hypothetical protein
LNTIQKVILLSVCVLSNRVYAQEKHNPTSLRPGIPDSVMLPDSSKRRITQRLEAIKGAMNDKQNHFKNKVDTVNVSSNTNKKADELTTRIKTEMEDVSSVFRNSVDKDRQNIGEGRDDIQKFADSLMIKDFDKRNHFTNKVTTVQQILSDKISELTGEQVKIPGQSVTLPDNDLPDVQVPGVNTPKLDLSAIMNMPNHDLPKAEGLKFPDGAVDVSKISDNTNVKLPGTTDLEKVKNATGEVDQVQGKIDEADKYKEEVGKIKEFRLSDTEKLPASIEEQATNLDQAKSVSEELQKASAKQLEYESVMQRYRDKKLIQEEMKRKAKNVANEKMVEFAPAMQKAQDQLAKAKKVNPFRQKIKNIVRSPHHAMKEKTFYERMVPGITFQVYNNDQFMLDVAPQIGYRLSTRLTTGIGGTYRISAGKQYANFLSSAGVYGYRIYNDFTLFKGIFVHAEFESLRLDSEKIPQLKEALNIKVQGIYFGLGKRYNISPKLKGSILALYRVEYKGDLPGVSKVNLRMGFDYNTKKKRKIQK